LGKAVVAATRAVGRHEPIAGGWHCACQPVDDEFRRDALDGSWEQHLAAAVVAVAVPHIEAAIREKIAAEIEAEKGHCIYGGNRGEAFDLGIHSAARVARGGSR
jgi:hypothetical protein